MRRLLSFIVVVLLSLGVVAIGAQADSPPPPEKPEEPRPEQPEPPFPPPSQQPPPQQPPPEQPPPEPQPAPAPAQEILQRGSSGPAVLELQERLRALHYDPGPHNGKFGSATWFALIAFQKVHGLPLSGMVGSGDREALARPRQLGALVGGAPNRVEVSLSRQLLVVYRDGQEILVSHISSGNNKRYCVKGKCGVAVTPRGTFSVLWTLKGWRTSRLGRLYNPVYFTKAGHAIHGSTSVPLAPASHGCIRIPMHTAQWFQSLVPRGTAVHVVG